ncbi:MAG: GFA family protein [Sulfitobacter sp.]|uniref:GFA family protein n=1 Tax=Antarcticimicrobium sp. TaxID=2824147 RepID=UPI00260BED05|nr:GFA family protein [Antarcticimicrobium sp.]MDF1718519.1 GFA family protein [Antarcticimicrobium sp.]MDF1727457.1 GFA family protein [Sulfitobacter sp.]
MPLKLEGSCRCGAVHFEVESHTPVPYQQCYCSICRKTDGGGGFAINLGANADSLTVRGRDAIGVFRAEIDRDGICRTSSAERHFCSRCGSALWVFDPGWPDLVHPFASAVDTDLPRAPERVHIFTAEKPPWVPLPDGPKDTHFAGYPELSLADWHKTHGLWVD